MRAHNSFIVSRIRESMESGVNTKPEVDDLDTTAELPQLDLAAAAEAFEAGNRNDESGRTDTWRAISSQVGEAGHDGWDLADELITVRDTIQSLQTQLTALQTAHADLGKRHDVLQADHGKLLLSTEEIAKDRERLAEERLLLLESNQQLRDQSALYRSETEGKLAVRDAEAVQHRQQIADLQSQSDKAHAESQATAASLQQRLDESSGLLTAEKNRVDELRIAVDGLQSAKEQQQDAAAKLAQSLALASIEKGVLQEAIGRRDQYIQQLQQSQHELERALSIANAAGEDLQDDVAEARQQHAAVLKSLEELQRQLASSEQRVTDLAGKTAAQEAHSQALEHERNSLRGVLEAERQSSRRIEQEAQQQREQLEKLSLQVSTGEAANAELNRQLGELKSAAAKTEHLLGEQQRELRAAAETASALREQQTQLVTELQAARQELEKTATALREEQQSSERLLADTETLRNRNAELERITQERDKFILEQSTELEQLQRTSQLLTDKTQVLEEDKQRQAQSIAALEAQLAEVRAGFGSQGEALQKLRQELSTKNAERLASAKQVSELQQQLKQSAEALNAIRVDIRKVARPAERRDAETLLRTLARIDDDSVVHLLNKNVMSVGRAADNDIQIHSDAISRHHANLRISREAVIVEDLGSTNGCYVNGRRVKRYLLKDGDKFEMGNIAFKFAVRPSQSSAS